MMTDSSPLLEVADLKTYYRVDKADADLRAVDGVSFELEQGQTLGLVGESGSGKTTIIRSILRLLPPNGRIAGGEINYKGTDLTEIDEKTLRKQYRWQEISMIPQNAMSAFDPIFTIGQQIIEPILYHRNDVSKSEAKELARELFDSLGLDTDRLNDYPHQLSGGMAQRAMIALALCLEPPLILADEPTTALDVVIQDRMLQTIADMQEQLNSAMILVAHDMSVVSETSDTIAVCYAGKIVEKADKRTIIKEPKHPYTMGLRNAFPDITQIDEELISIPGSPPELIDPEDRCQFADRCPFAEEVCWEESPEGEEIESGHYVECHRADEADELRTEAGKKDTWREDVIEAGVK
jgi:peptide/nickel transport system ATP-binding protein